jgi:hypothetical protein
MAIFFEIPLKPNAQKFFVALGGIQYQMSTYWRTANAGGWFIDIFSFSGNPILTGLPLVTGLNLLEPYPALNIGNGGALFVATDGDLYAVPTYVNLGVNSHLYFVPA